MIFINKYAVIINLLLWRPCLSGWDCVDELHEPDPREWTTAEDVVAELVNNLQYEVAGA